MKRFVVITMVLAGCIGIAAQAQLVVYDYGMPGGWTTSAQPGDPNPTFVLPADLSGINCGIENTTTCEPPGAFTIKTPWSGIPSYIAFTEEDGSLSDVVLFDSLAGGNFRVWFSSDPNLASTAGYFLYASLPEDDSSGVVTVPIGVCCEVAGLSIILASDGENYFDPFGVGFDTSDGIQFMGATYGGHIPEPSTFLMLGSGLLGAMGVVRRRMRL